MTVQNAKSIILHETDGIQAVFVYDFIILDEEHAYVFNDDGQVTEGWTIQGLGDPEGGTITFSPTIPDFGTMAIARFVPMTQLVDYQPYDAFPAETHERALDLGIMAIQQVANVIGGFLPGAGTGLIWQYPITAEGAPNVVPAPQPGEHRAVIYNDVEILVGPTATEIENAQGYAEAAAISAGESAASAGNADTSAIAALASEDKAFLWAQEDEDVEVETDLYSAFHWAQKAAGLVAGGPGEDFTSSTGATLVLDGDETIAWVHSLDQDVTISGANLGDLNTLYSFYVHMVQDGTGGWGITFPANTTWPYGELPLFPTDPNAIIKFALETYDGGTNWQASFVGGDYA